MTFGQALRHFREKNGWSRYKLLLKVLEHAPEARLTENAIYLLESGRSKKPHGTTRTILSKILPELSSY